jgi:hypothetical protein
MPKFDELPMRNPLDRRCNVCGLRLTKLHAVPDDCIEHMQGYIIALQSKIGKMIIRRTESESAYSDLKKDALLILENSLVKASPEVLAAKARIIEATKRREKQ